MSQTTLKHYNQLRSVRNGALRRLKITIYKVNKLKVETEVKEIDQKILYSVTIDIVKF